MFGDSSEDRRRRLRLLRDQAELRRTRDWIGKGHSGEEYREPGHLYQSDLNILGEGSLFELLATTRTEIGRRGLASYLLHPVSAEVARERQEAVRELRDLPKLREDVALLGPFQFTDCRANALNDWLDAPPVSFPAILRPVLLVSSITLLVLALTFVSVPALHGVLGSYLVALMAFHALTGFALHTIVRPLLQQGRELAPEITILSEGLTLVIAQKFASPLLRQLRERAREMPEALRRLARMMHWVRERDKEWFYPFFLYFMVGTQLAMAIEAWRAKHGQKLRGSIDVWAEFEALEAIGTFAHEHPGNTFPEFSSVTMLEAESIGHPLLPEESCVLNDVRFDDACRCWIISGSNMAGKSTLLRAMGTNVVLALAGAPVRASRMALAPLHVAASIATLDSLLDGKSRFMAEVERIRDSIAAASQAPVLFLIDEIFSGTNSHDRRIASESVIRALIDHGAIGAISTHDLALTEIAEMPSIHGVNVHMCSRNDEDALDFDYQVKLGVNRQSNALAIVRLAGVPL
jgi:hypothetical protein